MDPHRRLGILNILKLSRNCKENGDPCNGRHNANNEPPPKHHPNNTYLLFLVSAPFSRSLRYPVDLSRSSGPSFLCASGGFHIFLYLLLILFSDDFRKEATGEKLASINLANRITLIRVSTLPTLLFLVIAAKNYHIRFPPPHPCHIYFRH